MRTLGKRLETLEQQRIPPCHCVALEFTDDTGQPETPTPPQCPHGRPWRLIRRYINVDGTAV